MANVVGTNLFSLSAQRNLAANESMIAQSIERLSSGLRVNSAKDDAAGLAISDRMSTQIRGMNVAIRNAADGISLAQTAEAALSQITETMQRMREIGIQAMNGTNGTSDLAALQVEFAALGAELTRIGESTTFNGVAIIETGAGAKTFQVGANTGAANQISVTTVDVTGTTDAVVATNVSTGAAAAVTAIDTALTAVASQRATYGAAMNRFEATMQNLRNGVEAQSAARSRIVDADFAQETAALTKAQILQQSGIAVLAQANQAPQAVLSLLR